MYINELKLAEKTLADDEKNLPKNKSPFYLSLKT